MIIDQNDFVFLLKTNPLMSELLKKFTVHIVNPIVQNRNHLLLIVFLIQSFCLLLLEGFWEHFDSVAIVEQGGGFWGNVVVLQLKRSN